MIKIQSSTLIMFYPLLFVFVWLNGNILFFGTLNIWNESLEIIIHWSLVSIISSTVLLSALRSKGPIQESISHIFFLAAVLFGTYAVAILTGRYFFSRTIMLTAIPATLIISLILIWCRHIVLGVKVAIVEPLVFEVPSSLSKKTILTSPLSDFGDIDILLIDLHAPVSADWARALSRALQGGCRVRHIVDYMDDMAGTVAVESFELEHMPSASLSSYALLKRLSDIIGSVALLPIAIPLIMIAAVGVFLTSGGPAFFVQDRAGLGGKSFRMWKIRTMRPLPPGVPMHEAVPGDVRVTKIGRILRRTRVDELPQLWNVLKGDMSLIGPRPEAIQFHNSYTDTQPKFAYRCLVRPGISGWAQVNAPPSSGFDEAFVKLRYDLYYVKRHSASLDVQIVFRTLWTILHGSGVR
ncbi:MAG: sugar transferase [Caulobacteraceae bacterium]|nr:sugar transferase [Caulobacteraceae bacterium]